MKQLLLLLSILTHSSVGFAQRLYVCQDGSGNRNGESWENAMDDINQAVEKATSGYTIFVAPGTYEGGFYMKQGVRVIGSVAYGDDKEYVSRSIENIPENETTILDGKNRYRVITQENDFTESAVWEGFVIRNGNANEGAGVRLRKNGTIRNCMIDNNIAGMPSVGDYVANVNGIIFDVNQADNTISVISSKNIIQNRQFDRAKQLAGEYKIGSTSNWHIPTVSEWETISGFSTENQFKTGVTFKLIERTMQRHGKNYLSGNTFWTSTSEGTDVKFVNFNSNEISSVNKWQYNNVRVCKTYRPTNTKNNGGGINATGGTIDNCIIKGNTAANGSGVYARGNVTITNSTISENINEKQLDIDDKVVVDNTPNKISTLEAEKLSIGPNPVHAGQTITISPAKPNTNVWIYDLNGHMFSSSVLNSNQMAAPTQPGVYLVKIDNTQIIKLIVTK